MIAIAKKTTVCPHCDKSKLAIDYTKPTTFHEITESSQKFMNFHEINRNFVKYAFLREKPLPKSLIFDKEY